jgi:hypothetical protein
MAENNAVVGIYNSHTEAEASIKELQRSGFDMKKLSINPRHWRNSDATNTAHRATFHRIRNS